MLVSGRKGFATCCLVVPAFWIQVGLLPSLMEEMAMRKLTENATEQQIACIPRNRGESWIGLYNFPRKVKYWKMLNQYKATGTRGDRLLLMKQMHTSGLMLMFTKCFEKYYV